LNRQGSGPALTLEPLELHQVPGPLVQLEQEQEQPGARLPVGESGS